MIRTHARAGYVFLVTVLLVGTVATAIVTALLFLATNAGRTSLILLQSSRSMAYASTCIEVGIQKLRTDGSYAGNETLTFTQGTCKVLLVGGNGNENRTLCAEGKSGPVTRRLELSLLSILPSVQIASWSEVPVFTLCSSS